MVTWESLPFGWGTAESITTFQHLTPIALTWDGEDSEDMILAITTTGDIIATAITTRNFVEVTATVIIDLSKEVITVTGVIVMAGGKSYG